MDVLVKFLSNFVELVISFIGYRDIICILARLMVFKEDKIGIAFNFSVSIIHPIIDVLLLMAFEIGYHRFPIQISLEK